MQGTFVCLLRVEIVLRNFNIVYVQSDVCPMGSYVDFLLERYITFFVVYDVVYYEQNTLDLTANYLLGTFDLLISRYRLFPMCFHTLAARLVSWFLVELFYAGGNLLFCV